MARKSYVISGRDLRIRPGRNRPGEPGEPTDPDHPDNPIIPGPEDPYPPEGEDGEGGGGDYEDAIHPPPPHVGHAPGLYIGPTKGNPVIPVPAGEGEDHLKLPPGAVWPRRHGRVAGHYVALAYIPDHGWRYIVIDPDGWPEWPPHKPGEPTPPVGEGEGGEGEHAPAARRVPGAAGTATGR